MAYIRKRGHRWQAVIRRKGYPDEVKSFGNRADAERWARTLESEMDRGCYASRTEAEQATLAQMLEKYIEEVCPLLRGKEAETIRLKAVSRHRMAQLSMANLTPQAIAQYRDERLKKVAPATVVRDLAALSAVINHCRREWGISIVNPVEAVRKPSLPPGRDRVLQSDEEQRLLRELEPNARRNLYMRPLVIVAIETAMRRGELLGLRWDRIDLDRRVVFLPVTKNGKARWVPLSSRAADTLRNMPRSIDGRVFPLTIAAMEAAFRKACGRAGLSELRFHDLRHTGTTRLAEKLDNVLELAAVTGHTDLRMLKRYYHPRAEDLARKIG
jgi:integrase